MKSISKVSLIGLVLAMVQFGLLAQDNMNLKPSTISAYKARHIGPATMSGRISALDAVDTRPVLLYVGSAGGGVWKSNNGGVKFKPVFEKYTQSIGAIRIDPNHSDTVWVGTGEPWPRNSVSVGDGVYKTTDGGDSWKNMGLENTERIGRIVIHPSNPDTVYVAALGHLWNSNEDRGLYKTIDGGETWEKILYIDENTGCSDLAIDPENPEVLYAAMWDFQRKPWTFRSGGKGSGLYKTNDGGKTWEELRNGLPEGILGRIAVSVSPLTPNMVYATVESKESGLYRSDDYGQSWIEANNTIPNQERPFYFSYILADPVDTNRVYKPSFDLNVSKNKGENFSLAYVAGGKVHPDMHALWISKRDNNLLYMGSDGGVFVSRDKGSSWSMLRNLPVSQFYHVSVDMEKPYNVYGGLQDNGSWYGPSEKSGGITNSDWKSAGFGDGFSMIPDRYDNNIIFWQFQGGEFFRFYKASEEIKLIKPFPDSEADNLRYNWNAAIELSPSRDVMYVGAQYLFQSHDKGDSWKRISPDLTTNDPEKQKQYETGGLTLDNSSAENHCSIVTISESPKDSKVIWVGTDDGNLQVTKDEGKTWTNVVSYIENLPENTWCSYVYTSTFDAGIAYVTFDGHRNGDKNPYVYKTTDYGQSWENLVDENIEGYCHSIVQDIVNPSLLFLGTEFGLFASFNNGSSWVRMEGDIPKVSVREIVIHPRENDLVLGTHGRGILIVDDISCLRQLTPEILEKEVAFLETSPSVIGNVAINSSYDGDDEFVGKNPPDAAIITYFLKKRHVFGNMHLEIYDEEGNFLVKLPAGKRKGLNRVPWTLMKKPPKVPTSPSMAQFALFGPFYDPGTYTVKLIKGKDTYEGKVSLILDPDSPHSKEDKELRIKTINLGYRLLEDLGYVDAKATEVSKQAREISSSMNGSTKKKLIALADELEGFHKEMVETKMGGITGEEKLRGKISFLYGTTILYKGRPTESQINGLNALEKEVIAWEKKVDDLLAEQLPKLNKTITKQGKEAISIPSLEEFKKAEN